MAKYSAKVSEVIKATPTVGVVRLAFEGEVPFDFKPGQYILVHVQGKIKPYSIASPPSEKGFIELCIKDVPEGAVSSYMVSLKEGEQLEISGPGGIFTLQDTIENDIVFAGTGTGISALKPMIETIFEQGTDKSIYLFFGARAEEEIVYKKEFEEIAEKNKNFHFIPVISRDPDYPGEKGHVQDIIPKHVPDPTGKDIYICGVLKMVEATISWAEQFGFDKKKIHFEKYV